MPVLDRCRPKAFMPESSSVSSASSPAVPLVSDVTFATAAASVPIENLASSSTKVHGFPLTTEGVAH